MSPLSPYSLGDSSVLPAPGSLVTVPMTMSPFLPPSLPVYLWYLFVTSFMCVKTLVFNVMNGDTILEHVLLLPGTQSQD